MNEDGRNRATENTARRRPTGVAPLFVCPHNGRHDDTGESDPDIVRFHMPLSVVALVLPAGNIDLLWLNLQQLSRL